jgi:ribosomal protein L11 methylase PrmA
MSKLADRACAALDRESLWQDVPEDPIDQPEQSTFPMRVYTWRLDEDQANALGEWVDNLSAFEDEGGLWHLQVCCPVGQGPLPDEVLEQFVPDGVDLLTYDQWCLQVQQPLPPIQVGPFFIHSPQPTAQQIHRPADPQPTVHSPEPQSIEIHSPQSPSPQMDSGQQPTQDIKPAGDGDREASDLSHDLSHDLGLPPGHSLAIGASLAFGSGHHETTQGCLSLIARMHAKDPWIRALDWGCGSGILALAMNCLVPGSTEGIDCDQQAVKVANSHSQLNGIATRFFLAEQPPSQAQYDAIVANLLAPLLVRLAPQIALSRQVILSGMLADQVPQVMQAYQSHGMELIESCPLGEWVSLWLGRPDGPSAS